MLDARQEGFQQPKVKHRLRDHVLRSSLDLVLEPANLFIQIRQPRVRSDANHKARSHSDRIAAQIEPTVQVVHNVDEANGIHVKHSSRVRIIAHFRRIAGDANQIPDTDCGRSQQVTLDAQHIPVAARIMQNRVDAYVALNKQRQRLVAHARRRARAVWDIDRVHTNRLQKPRSFNFFLNIDSLGRDDLNHRDKLASSQLGAEKRSIL